MHKNKILLASLLSVCGLAFLFQGMKGVPYESVEDLRVLYGSGDTSSWPKPSLDSSVIATFQEIGPLRKVVHPEENPYSKAKADLGKMLFFDPRLSSSGQIACASCHNPELAWTDNLTRSFGHDRQNGSRNAMTILNVGHATSLFWDGRADDLEAQAAMPIADPKEMNQHPEIAAKSIRKIKAYTPLFEEAFPKEGITTSTIQKALATFQRTITSEESKFDRFVSGKSPDALTDEQVLGLHLFRTKARCINCHNTPYFSDQQFHNDGQTLFGTKNEDFGRYLITFKKEDIGKFKTPTLREVARTGPWMHHGHFPSLLDVVQFYNLGNPSPIQKRHQNTGRDSLLPVTSPLLRKLDLSRDEEKALVAFLETLSTPVRRMRMPELPK